MDAPTLIVFDLETTGLSPVDSGIIEIAAVEEWQETTVDWSVP